MLTACKVCYSSTSTEILSSSSSKGEKAERYLVNTNPDRKHNINYVSLTYEVGGKRKLCFGGVYGTPEQQVPFSHM